MYFNFAILAKTRTFSYLISNHYKDIYNNARKTYLFIMFNKTSCQRIWILCTSYEDKVTSETTNAYLNFSIICNELCTTKNKRIYSSETIKKNKYIPVLFSPRKKNCEDLKHCMIFFQFIFYCAWKLSWRTKGIFCHFFPLDESLAQSTYFVLIITCYSSLLFLFPCCLFCLKQFPFRLFYYLSYIYKNPSVSAVCAWWIFSLLL